MGGLRVRVRLGVVADYDAARGLGTVREGRGGAGAGGAGAGAEHMFHCTAIADGSRLIDPGTEVAFVLERAVGGQIEARSLTQLER